MTDIVERLQYYTPYDPITDMQADALMKEAADEIERQAAELRSLREALRRAETILGNMAQENDSMFNRWPIHHEPLRADARNLLPEIRSALKEKE